MAQGGSTKIISMIKWIRTSRLSIKNSLSGAEGKETRTLTHINHHQTRDFWQVSLTLSHTLSFSLTHTHFLSLSHTHTLSLSLSLSRTHTYTHTHSLSLFRPLSFSFSLSFSLSPRTQPAFSIGEGGEVIALAATEREENNLKGFDDMHLANGKV